MNYRTFLSASLFWTMLICIVEGQAQQARSTLPLISHLLTVNQKWLLYDDRVPESTFTSFATDQDRIREHLLQVEAQLRFNTPFDGSDKARLRRMALLDTLHNYAIAARFPQNTHHRSRTPYFIDDAGTACAVGHLLIASGAGDIAQTIHNEYNYEFLAQIPMPEVMDWAEENGFRFEELEWIQPTYQPHLFPEPVGQGTDSTVRCIAPRHNDGVFLGGQFAQVDGKACIGLGHYKAGNFDCDPTGIPGSVLDISASTSIYAAGSFQVGGQNYGLIYRTDTTSWEAIDLPGISGYVGTAVHEFNEVVLLAERQTVSGLTRLWKGEQGSWTKLATINGRINTITQNGSNYIFAGSFDSVTVNLSNGDSTFHASNMLGSNWNQAQWRVFPDDIDNEVFAVEPVGSFLYIGGRCKDSVDNSNTFCLATFRNGSVQQIVDASSFTSANKETAIYDIDLKLDETSLNGDIVFAGNFEHTPSGIGTYFKGLALYDPLLGFMEPYGTFDGPVYSIHRTNTGLFVGGDFSSEYGEDSLYNICFIPHEIPSTTPTIVVERPAASGGIKLFPNPANDFFSISAEHNLKSVQVKDMRGATVFSIVPHPSREVSVSTATLDIGMYLIEVTDIKGGSFTEQLLVSE